MNDYEYFVLKCSWCGMMTLVYLQDGRIHAVHGRVGTVTDHVCIV